MEEKIVKPQMDTPVAPVVAENPNGKIPSQPIDPETPKNEHLVEDEKVAGDMTIPSDPYLTSPLFYEVTQYFGVQQGEYEAAKNELSAIVDYIITEGKSNKTEDILVNLRQLEDKLQPPGWDEKRYKNVYKYIRLAAKKSSFEKAMSAFERGVK